MIAPLPLAYNDETKTWKQAHTQARNVIYQFIKQNQKSDIIDIELVRTNGTVTDYNIKIDKELMATEGKELIKLLLQTL